jgi:hypothetical protein
MEVFVAEDRDERMHDRTNHDTEAVFPWLNIQVGPSLSVDQVEVSFIALYEVTVNVKRFVLKDERYLVQTQASRKSALY